MKDRSVQFPNRYKMTQVSDGVYDLVAQPGAVTEAGTVLNKANLLSDSTASAIGGLSSDPTVNEALAKLHSLITSAQNTANGRTQTQIVSYVGTGTYGKSNPNSVTFNFVPKFVFVLLTSPYNGPLSSITTYTFAHWVYNSTNMYNNYSYNGTSYGLELLIASFSGRTLKYYSTEGDASQLNIKDCNYCAIAFA